MAQVSIGKISGRSLDLIDIGGRIKEHSLRTGLDTKDQGEEKSR